MTEITPEQCRAARGLLNWPQIELAKKSGVSKKTVEMYELGKVDPRAETLAALRKALEKAGVIFIAGNGEGPGVRQRRRK